MKLLPLLALLLAACGAPPSREFPAAPPPDNAFDPEGRPDPGEDAIVAFVDGEPVRWRVVADRAMATRGKELIDQYIRWKLRQDRIRDLGIANTADELRGRARAILDVFRKQAGEAELTKRLDEQKVTEAEYIERFVTNPEFDDHVKSEKAVAYSRLTEASIEIETAAFTEREDAEMFAAFAAKMPFGQAAEKLFEIKSKGKVAQWPRYRFPRGLAPDSIADTPALEQKLFGMQKGETTRVEQTAGGILVVILVADVFPADPAPYAKAAGRVFAEVLRQPPSEAQMRLWVDRLFKSKRIQYEDRYTPGNKGR
jgi:hypothetical protein